MGGRRWRGWVAGVALAVHLWAGVETARADAATTATVVGIAATSAVWLSGGGARVAMKVAAGGVQKWMPVVVNGVRLSSMTGAAVAIGLAAGAAWCINAGVKAYLDGRLVKDSDPSYGRFVVDPATGKLTVQVATPDAVPKPTVAPYGVAVQEWSEIPYGTPFDSTVLQYRQGVCPGPCNGVSPCEYPYGYVSGYGGQCQTGPKSATSYIYYQIVVSRPSNAPGTAWNVQKVLWQTKSPPTYTYQHRAITGADVEDRLGQDRVNPPPGLSLTPDEVERKALGQIADTMTYPDGADSLKKANPAVWDGSIQRTLDEAANDEADNPAVRTWADGITPETVSEGYNNGGVVILNPGDITYPVGEAIGLLPGHIDAVREAIEQKPVGGGATQSQVQTAVEQALETNRVAAEAAEEAAGDSVSLPDMPQFDGGEGPDKPTKKNLTALLESTAQRFRALPVVGLLLGLKSWSASGSGVLTWNLPRSVGGGTCVVDFTKFEGVIDLIGEMLLIVAYAKSLMYLFERS